MSTINSKSNVDALNAEIRACTPRGQRAAKIKQLEKELAEVSAALVAVTGKLGELRSAMRATAKPKAKGNIAFWERSPAHRAAYLRMHGSIPKK